ncbi:MULTISPECIES: PQQ-dependent sugar dehydrogenase [Methylococcus]|uniref:Sorbosone dehydrogenase family protein n=1 Tax=Methylococcus capsulatus TaxID=414 RepID=A0ABZ2F8T9_METCP|nr:MULTISPECIES: sorbosone dehydrogenase family protein [Methylococcus]MDF9392902.1 sorbosone dehydrogenase family protein [Methylococcus capsulatus]
MNKAFWYVVLPALLFAFLVQRFGPLAVNLPLKSVFGVAAAPAEEALRQRIVLPPGFSVTVYAADLPGVRMLRFTGTGDLLVSQPNAGAIVLLEKDADGDGHPDGRRQLLTDLSRPHGLDLRNGWLYVAETYGVVRVRYDATQRQTSGAPETVVSGIPGGGNHWSRTLKFGPDGGMYVSVGSSCNVCIEDDPLRATLLRFEPDGTKRQIYATGLRNTVGFDWHPGTRELYGTDNGRDLLGDDFPPCELNRIEKGGFYGWPYANGNRVPDPDYGRGHEADIQRSLPPVYEFRAHVAPLGMVFLKGAGLPQDYRGAALVALHGSWNRSKKQGYEVVSLHFGADGRIAERPFMSGFNIDEDVIGRPVDVAEGPDGAIYVSDDYAGAIYRVRYEVPAAASHN